MSTVNLKKFFYYPAPPPHIINYSASIVKHFIALIYGRRTASERSERAGGSLKRQASEASRRQGTSITPPAVPDSIS